MWSGDFEIICISLGEHCLCLKANSHWNHPIMWSGQIESWFIKLVRILQKETSYNIMLLLLLPICAGGSRLKYLDVSCVLGCVSGMFNMFNMSGMVMDSIGAGVVPVAGPPHCVPVFWAVQCLVSGQGRISASLSGGQPIISVWAPCTMAIAMCSRPYSIVRRTIHNSQVTFLQPIFAWLLSLFHPFLSWVGLMI